MGLASSLAGDTGAYDPDLVEAALAEELKQLAIEYLIMRFKITAADAVGIVDTYLVFQAPRAGTPETKT